MTAEIVLSKFTSTTFLKLFSAHIQDVFETGEALGRSVIVEKDRVLGGEESKKFSLIFAATEPVRVSFDLLPKEALDYIRYKALTIAGVEHGELLLAVKKKLIQALSEGRNFDEWRKEIDQIFDSYGVTKLGQRHLETIFRTNVFTAYSEGQLNQAMEMSEQFPLWRYSAIRDDRTRPDHLALDGKLFPVGEGPIPPIDYNCRCTAVYLHASEVERSGLKPGKWNGTAGRFNTRQAFDEWKQSKQEAMTGDVERWIRQNL